MMTIHNFEQCFNGMSSVILHFQLLIYKLSMMTILDLNYILKLCVFSDISISSVFICIVLNDKYDIDTLGNAFVFSKIVS